MKNYYQILNVQPTATEDDIKRSYRVLAKRYHPDVNPGDKSAADKFADINEAHDTLSDPQKRKEYDAKLKEASAPKPKPEDIIAQQRAAAQAAARAAAMRGNPSAARATAYKRDPTMTISQQRAAAAAAVAAAHAANMQAAAAAQAQAQAAQIAQMNAMKNQAYTQGYERGVADGKKAMEQALEQAKAKYEAEIQSLNDKSDELYDQLAETEGDRSGLEQELFNRDRELTTVQTALKELEKRYETEIAQLNYQIESLQSSKRSSHGKTVDKPKHSDAEYDALKADYEAAQTRIRELQTEINQSELKNKAQLQLQMDKRKQLQDEVAELRKQVDTLNHELAAAQSENAQWQDYAENEQFLSESEEKLAEWDKKQKADKKLSKPTLYGSLGVLIWATAEQIDAAYAKLCKKLTTAEKGDKADEARAKRAAADSAYAVLSDPQRRVEYNASIGITEDRVEEERELIRENAEIEAQYRARLADKEFWDMFDELTFNAQTGDAEAQCALGELYYDGNEIELDLDTAVYWFKEAAKQKYPDAMFMLGVCFITGEGVDQNPATGVGFIRQAAKLGSTRAREYMEKNKL